MGDNSVTAGNQPSALHEVTELWNVDRRDIKVWESRRGGSQRFDSVKKEYVTAEIDSITQEDPWWMVKCLMNCLRDSCRVSGCHILPVPWSCSAGARELIEWITEKHSYIYIYISSKWEICVVSKLLPASLRCTSIIPAAERMTSKTDYIYSTINRSCGHSPHKFPPWEISTTLALYSSQALMRSQRRSFNPGLPISSRIY